MSLKIKISKQSISSEPKVNKRRIQRIDSEDDEDNNVHHSSYDPDIPEPRSKKARTLSRGASVDSGDDAYAGIGEDGDVDIDGEIEDTRFLPEPPPPVSQTLSPAASSSRRRSSTTASSSSKSRFKERESRSGKNGKAKKPKRQVVYTDSEEEFEDPDVVVTDDDDFDPDPEPVSTKKSSKGLKLRIANPGAKGKTAKKEEITFRDERRVAPQAPPAEETKSAISALDEPIPKKRKLPPIKKNKPAGATTGPSTPAAKLPPPPPASVSGEKKETLTPAPTSNQVGSRKPAGASADLNLLDSSVYSELFKSAQPGTSTPNSGLNRKQKEEERKKELNRMRNEARAKREAESRNSFDLQAAPEKIQRYEESLRTHRSIARYPNILGGSFKDMWGRHGAPRAAAVTAPEPR